MSKYKINLHPHDIELPYAIKMQVFEYQSPNAVEFTLEDVALLQQIEASYQQSIYYKTMIAETIKKDE